MGRVLFGLGTALVGLMTVGCGFGGPPPVPTPALPTATISKPAILLTPRPTAPPTPTAQLEVARLPIVTPGPPRPTATSTPSVRGTPVRASEPLAGLLVDDHMVSPIIGQTFLYRVYLPPDYVHSQKRYPVLYMLHGAGGNYTEWTDSYLPETADRMMVAGDIPPMIIVMPDDGEATYWANWSEGGPRWGDYLTEDVVSMVDQRYRTLAQPQSRAVGGLSMGGLGALNLAFEHPEVFGVVGAHSPSVRLEPDPALWFLVGQNFWEHNPAWLAKNRTGLESLDIWIDAGTDDIWLPNIEAVHSALLEEGIKPSWHVFPGPHEAEYCIEHVPDYLRFYGASVRT
jgi:enterochelin esterase-like enzyme